MLLGGPLWEPARTMNMISASAAWLWTGKPSWMLLRRILGRRSWCWQRSAILDTPDSWLDYAWRHNRPRWTVHHHVHCSIQLHKWEHGYGWVQGFHLCRQQWQESLQMVQWGRRGADRETGAIDHCLVYDPSKSAEVKVFDCIMEEYTVKLTDHYPNIIDVRL